DLGLHERVYILAGVGPLRSPKTAEFMRTHVPGVVIPDAVVDRLKKTPKPRWQEEGMAICVEIIEQVRQIPGVKGVHVMAYRQEEMVAEIIRRSSLFPRVPPSAVRPSAAAA
ncbi:MAG: methylenetetrahydrofolate reductase, partial [Anaerolineales bacterium]